ncbi:S8 family serine peptidase [Leptospira sp. 96542]|nr:S8 family serine peptidase [Leptospira sp. 96542]
MNIRKQTLTKIGLIATLFVATNILVSEPLWNPKQSSLDIEALRKKSKEGKKLPYLPGEVVIKFKKQIPDTDLLRQTSKLGQITGVLNTKGHFTTAKLFESETMEQGLARISKDPDVEFVEPRYLYYKQADAPNDTDFSQLWGLRNNGQIVTNPSYTANSSNDGTSGKDMNVLGGWDVTTSCTGDKAIVAVLDTGVTYTHEDLVGNMWSPSGGCVNQNGVTIGAGCPNHGWDFANNDNDPRDEEGHGTHVAMTIGAVGNNNKGISGVCQSAKIMAVRVLGLGGGSNDTIANGINFAVRNGAKVINMSLGGSQFSQTMLDAIEFARQNDVLVVVAAGNSTLNLSAAGNNSYPCEYDKENLICIAALDQKYVLANFSNYDNNATTTSRSVDFGAPGTNIYSGYGIEVTQSETQTTYENDWVNIGASGNPWTYHSCSFLSNGNSVTLSGLYLPNDCSVIGWNFTPPYNNPTAMPLGSNRTVYKNFSISSAATSVRLNQVLISDGEGYDANLCFDYTEMKHSATAGNPFPNGTTISLIDDLRGVYMDKFCRKNSAEYSFISTESPVLFSCIGSSNCSVGYRFFSDFSTANGGALATEISMTTWAPSNTVYANLNGTSMASPNAAGVAALIRSYNPNFTYSDVITKLIEGGVTEGALTGTTKYGKAINANDSLKHLKQVTGVTAVLQ